MTLSAVAVEYRTAIASGVRVSAVQILSKLRTAIVQRGRPRGSLSSISGAMNEYEQEVLHAIIKGAGQYGWYKIEQCLSSVSIKSRGNLPDVLRDLESRGLIRTGGLSGYVRYNATEAGRRIELAYSRT